MNNLFTTEDLIQLTELKRHHLEYYRKEKIIIPISDKPLRWNYETVIFCLMIKEFKEKMNKSLALDCVKYFLKTDETLSFINDSNDFIIISDFGKQFVIIFNNTKENDENKELFKYFETPLFLDLDDFNTGRRMQIILNTRYVFYIRLAKEHINKLCIDYGYGDKIPSISSLSSVSSLSS